ncbi:MAG: patatin-like phospholipase family protein [Reyranellaceae bacterium]
MENTHSRNSAAGRPVSRRRIFRLAAGGGLTATLPACALPERSPPVPAAIAYRATVLGIANERFYPVAQSQALDAEFIAAMERQQRHLGLRADQPLPELKLLSVSGGGENGAFGAGLLCGWTEQGTRPEFDMVTGVSTGALTAPFAFLGPRYDAQLRAVYTELKPDNILKRRGIVAALFDDALADNSPLYDTITRYFDAPMLAGIAREYQAGRLLLIGTANIDAQRAVVWNIGAIAASGHPAALETIRRVLLASAAVPGAFPPTMFDVSIDGKAYQEMHVDGGAFAQVFLYPTAALQRRRARLRARENVMAATAYIIRNAQLEPHWEAVDRRTLSIVGRAISTMIAGSGYNDVLRIYKNTRDDRIDFNLAYIGADFTRELPQPFDPEFMRALFDYGFERGRRGYDWAKTPPGAE